MACTPLSYLGFVQFASVMIKSQNGLAFEGEVHEFVFGMEDVARRAYDGFLRLELFARYR